MTSVRPPDDTGFDPWVEREERLPALLAANRDRRLAAARELDDLRRELADLLARGRVLHLSISHMARIAGISRDTAHRHLRTHRKEQPDTSSDTTATDTRSPGAPPSSLPVPDPAGMSRARGGL